MTLKPRIIARLDIKGPNLVKGIHLEGLRVLGNPQAFAEYYSNHGADEILYQDVVASLYDRNHLGDLIRKTADKTNIPICVGGGLRTIEDIHAVLRAGADKVAINTAAIARPEFIKEAAQTFGSSTIVVAIEAISQPDGSYTCFTDNGREETKKDAFKWAQEASTLGAGEILWTSVNVEGTGKGFDISAIQKVSKSIDIPLIAHGGAGAPEDVLNAFQNGQADAVCLASILHYKVFDVLVQTNEPSEGNKTFMTSQQNQKRIKPYNISEIKDFLRKNNIPVRV